MRPRVYDFDSSAVTRRASLGTSAPSYVSHPLTIGRRQPPPTLARVQISIFTHDRRFGQHNKTARPPLSITNAASVVAKSTTNTTTNTKSTNIQTNRGTTTSCCSTSGILSYQQRYRTVMYRPTKHIPAVGSHRPEGVCRAASRFHRLVPWSTARRSPLSCPPRTAGITRET